MPWVIFVVIVGILTCIAVFGTRPMRIPREPDRESIGDIEALRAYDRVSRWWIFGYERHIITKTLAEARPQGTLVDIGCGPGYLAASISEKFPGLRVIGLDNDDGVLRIARDNWSHTTVEFLTADVHRLPFNDRTVDCVVTSLSLHHWTDGQAGLREINRVLKPGSRLLILDLRRDGWRGFYWGLVLTQTLFTPSALRRINGAVGSFWSSYTPTEVKDLLSNPGWQELDIEKHFGWFVARARKATER
jgi:ubiquinone/menaquinone biosynthesis C-methylase UbiE